MISETMKNLKTDFTSRADLISYVKKIAPWAEGEASSIRGGESLAREKLKNIDPVNYGRTRNYANGKVTKLSAYIHHGIVSLSEIRDHAINLCKEPVQITKFIQELAWRDFWQRFAEHNPKAVWNDIENYKTGFGASDYSDNLPEDILTANTGVACIDSFIRDLIDTGYVHNHARMYIASYVVHFRRIKWQAGAAWFLKHLLDGDVASNNLSWQWVASTFSNKPYIFNLENVDKYFGKFVDTSPITNQILHLSYEALSRRLFPNLIKEA